MIYFAIGFLLGTLGITIINCLCDMLLSLTELFKSKIEVQIIENNNTLQQEGTKVNAIGFELPYDEDEDVEDE